MNETRSILAAIVCLILSPIALADQGQHSSASGALDNDGAFSYADNVHASYDGYAHGTAYPDHDVLLSLYRDLKKMGLIKKGEGPLAFETDELVVDEQLLRTVYDWATDNDLVTADDLTLRTQVVRGNGPSSAKISAACAGAYAACMVENVTATSGLMGLGCVAAAAEGGVNPFANAWCATQIAAGFTTLGLTCLGGINASCKGNSPDPDLFNAVRFGSNQGAHSSGTCSQTRAMVTELSAWTNGGIVRKVKAKCSDGSTFVVGTGTGTESTVKCGWKHTASGLRGRAGVKIDSVGLLCDYGPEAGNKWKNIGSLLGGTGGTSYKSQCPDGTGYLHGINARESWHYIKSNRFLYSIQAVCRNY